MSASEEELNQARIKALSSSVRLRILRLCLHAARTNREIAQLMEMNPATALHHVRTLVSTGFLEAQAERPGKQGAREIPYLATRRSFRQEVPGIAPILIETLMQEVEGLPPEEIEVTRLGLMLNAEHQAELRDRLETLTNEYAARPADPDGSPTSLFMVHHPDRSAISLDPPPN
ncbi:ArsR/SmtB family transcription factor [Psychromicrobium xiongbiense]|uniref:ArsR/SmtB family transcription factor n=1 Tax=Psychromicrobium xiongbiense TaxID=3051184 RepID=UPI002552801B|nr:winged helix-turn-helix domain-containing protein [Psychromicrobium sp. YIM S02556]